VLTNEEWRLIDTIGQSPKIVYKDGGLRSTLPLWTLWPSLNEKGKADGYYNNPLTVGGKMSHGLPLFEVNTAKGYGGYHTIHDEVQLDVEVNLPFFTSQEDCLKYTLMLSMLAENCGGVAMTRQDFQCPVYEYKSDYTKSSDWVLEDGRMVYMSDFDKSGQYSELKMYNYERLWDSEQARFTLKGLEPAYTPTAMPVLPFILEDKEVDIYDMYRKLSKEAMMMKATLNALIEKGKTMHFPQHYDNLLQPFMDEEE